MQIKLIALGLIALAGATSATASNLVINGGFEVTTNGLGQFDNNTVVTGWSSNGYNFVFDGNNAGGTVQGQYGSLALWAPSNGSANGLGASPTGGNFVGADGAFGQAPIEQTIYGLTAGKKYVVSFDWGGAQQLNFDGATTERWDVTFGGNTISTATLNNADHGFTGWQHEKVTFTANGGSQILSFFAVGTPNGVPPFSLLDGVSLNAAVPEASTWAMLIAGFGLVGAAARRRRQTVVAA